MIRRAPLALAALVALAASAVAHAHGGGVDGHGCHADRMKGGYHCHTGPLAEHYFDRRADLDAALERVGAVEALPRNVIVGRASVVDGDTIEIRDITIRLFGIDAPESGQFCVDGEGRRYRCGQRAAFALADQIGARAVSCEERDIDRYQRVVAVCSLGGVDLNAWMVLEGWALAYRAFSVDYLPDERAAEAARRGIWRGEFARPDEWRSRS